MIIEDRSKLFCCYCNTKFPMNTVRIISRWLDRYSGEHANFVCPKCDKAPSSPILFTMSNETKTRELLTITEAAEYLNSSHWTIRKWLRQKRIPYLQVNSRVIRIEKENLDDFVRDNTIPAKKI